MGWTRSNYEPGSVICFSFKSNLLNDQHILLDWKNNPKINIGSVKKLAWGAAKFEATQAEVLGPIFVAS